MRVFVDTSGLFALLNAQDDHHREADAEWQAILAGEHELICTNYVLLETFALVQNRLGLAPIRRLYDELCPLLDIQWITEEIHAKGVVALLAADRRQLSLVDCVSFEVMRRLEIQYAFAFDPHFEDQGFEHPSFRT